MWQGSQLVCMHSRYGSLRHCWLGTCVGFVGLISFAFFLSFVFLLLRASPLFVVFTSWCCVIQPAVLLSCEPFHACALLPSFSLMPAFRIHVCSLRLTSLIQLTSSCLAGCCNLCFCQIRRAFFIHAHTSIDFVRFYCLVVCGRVNSTIYVSK